MKNLMLAALVTLISATSAFAGGWAAIVYHTPSGNYAAARGADTRELAEETALKYCPDCNGTSVAQLQENSRIKKGDVRETFVLNGWIALAVGRGNTHWGTGGLHDSRANAEASALKNCGGEANQCYVARSLSSYEDGSGEDGAVPPPAVAPAIAPTAKPVQ